VRNPDDPEKTDYLRKMAGADRLTLVAADLNDPAAFDACCDVDGVFHVASPYQLFGLTHSVTL